jgi:hypothetical protein
VFVPAGASRIEMVYRPWAFRIGLWFSLFTVLGLVASFIKLRLIPVSVWSALA